MEFGIFDFYKVFSRAFGEEGNGAARIKIEAKGCRRRPRTPLTLCPRHLVDAQSFAFFIYVEI